MGFIDYEVDGQVGIITINRPKALNALNSEVLKDLDATIDAVDLDAIRCLITVSYTHLDVYKRQMSYSIHTS